MFMMLDDSANSILIQNNAGKIQIACSGPVEIDSSSELKLKGSSISLISSGPINFIAGGSSAVIDGSGFGTTGDINCKDVLGFLPQAEPGGGAQRPSPRGGKVSTISREQRSELKPASTDRSFAPNMPIKIESEQSISGQCGASKPKVITQSK